MLEGGSDAARSFLTVGGYVYLDEQHQILHATTLVPSGSEAGGLQFERYKPWRSEWTAGLMKQGRFQRITIRALNAVGAHHFAWLRPGEIIRAEDGTPCAQQPSVPHGGFAYLFHDDVFSTDEEALALDRVFACASGDEYIAAESEAEVQAEAPLFDLVSELAELHVLHDARRDNDAAPHSELQGRVSQLERQLDAATKCVACLVDDKDTVLNCGHVCLCQACAGRVTQCPICRVRITERRRVFSG